MLRRIRQQAILLDRFWAAIRNDPRRRTLPPAGLGPEIADRATRLASDSRSLAPTSAFRAALRAQIESAAQATPIRHVASPIPQTDRTLPEAALVPDDEGKVSRRHPASEWARFIAAVLAFFVVGGLLVALLSDSYENHTGSISVTATPTTDLALAPSLPPGLPVQIELNSGRPSWGMAFGADSLWVGTVTDDGSAVVRAAQTGRLGGEVQATIPLPGRVWDVAYGHGSVWATVIGDSLTGEGSALVRIDPASNAITDTIPLGAQPTSILIDDDAIWVTDLGDPTVWRVDPATNSIAATIALGRPGDGDGVRLARIDDDLWALVPHANGDYELARIYPATNAVQSNWRTFEEDVLGDVVAAGGSLWITTANNSVYRLEPISGEMSEPIELPGLPLAIMADDAYVWVATTAWSPNGSVKTDGWLNALVLIDVPSGRVYSITDLHENVPYALAVSDDSTWGSRIWISLISVADQQARLLGESRPNGISFDTTPPTATVGPEATPIASPSIDPIPTPVPPTSTREPIATPIATDPRDAAPAGEITATFDFAGGLGQPAWGAGALWVPNRNFGVVDRIDAETEAVTRIQVSPPGPASDGIWMCLAADDNAVWVSDNTTHELVRIDPVTYEIAARIPLAEITPSPGQIESIAVGEGAVWVILDDTEVVVRIDPASNTVAVVIDVPGASSMAVGLGAVWVQNIWTAEILRIDPATNEVIATIPTGPSDFNNTSLAIGAGSLWIEDGGDAGTVERIDPATNTIVATTAVLGLDQSSLAADDTGVWALFVRSSLLVRIDPLTLETRTLEIAAPAGVTIGGGSVWVTTAAGSPNTVIRITPTP